MSSLASDRVGIGIIGCGKISDAYVHGIRRYPGLHLIGCADLDVSRAKAKAAEHALAYGSSVDDLLRDPAVHMVVNLTIPQAHAEINRRILEAGKHAYTEKPFALRCADAEAVLALAQNKRLRIGSAPDTFLGGGQQTCRKLIDDGAIGQPIAATAFMLCRGHETWHPSPAFYYQPGGGPMMDMGPYYITALVNMLGPVVRVSGSARATFNERTITSLPLSGTKIPVEVPTHYAGTMEFGSGAIATIVMSFDVYPYPFPPIVVFGTEGSLEVPDPNTFGGDVRVSRHGGAYEHAPHTHTTDRGRGTGLADMAYALRSGREHRANGTLAYHVLEVMGAFDAAAKTQQSVHIRSSCARPAMLPPSLAADELDM
jgi:predicted dehydrogenase